MSILTRITDWLGEPGPPPMRPGVEPTARAYVVGESAVRPGEDRWGHDDADFSPPEYLDYVATSNNVYTCVTRRANAMSSLPLVLYKGKKKDTRKEVEVGKLRDLLDSVNPWMTLDRLVHLTEQYLCLSGEAFWFLERGTSKSQPPTEIWPVRPDWVKIVPHAKDFISGFLLFPPDGGTPIPYTPDEVIWFALPNPLDPYSGLAPLAAARLAADTAQAAMQSNRAIFANGTQLGGVISPADKESAIGTDQARELQDALSRKFKGVSNAHRIAIFDFALKYQQWTMTPKDAEFLGALDLTLEEIARAFGIAPDLLGGSKRTYQNAPEARYAFWADTVKVEAQFVANVVTERLLPMFPGEADVAEFDFDDVDAMKENEDAKWARERAQIDLGVLSMNEWRADRGLPPTAWGDAWWAQTAGGGLAPVIGPFAPISANQEIQFGGITVNEHRTGKGLPPVPWGDEWWTTGGTVPIGGPMAAAAEQAKADAAAAMADALDQQAQQPPAALDDGMPDDMRDGQDDTARSRRYSRAVEFGGAEHERLWSRAVARTGPWERRVEEVAVGLLRRQRQAILANLRQQDVRSHQRLAAKDLIESIFALPRWIREFRTASRPVLTEIVREAGEALLLDLSVATTFNLSDPNVVRALERQAQRFAVEVNRTTWDRLRATLADGLDAGEGTDALAARVEAVMGDRIRSSGETIARTEVLTASTTGSIESARQSGVVRTKTWLAALDNRTRDTHVEAHGQTVGIDGDFAVGGARGQGPGLMGAAEEDVNCRCSLTFGLDTDEPRAAAPNGHVTLIRLAEALGVKA